MTAFLPQQESLASGLLRKGRLIWDQWHYKYDYTHVSPLAIAHRVPIEDEFSFKWLALMSERLLDALANRAELELGEQATAVHTTKQKLLAELLKSGIGSIFAIKELVSEHLKFHGRFGAPATPAKTLQEYAELFRTFGLPPISVDFQNDAAFAGKRVAGPNPIMLRRMAARDGRLPMTDALFQEAVANDSFDAALAEGRLYLADFAVLDGAELSSYPNGQKYLYAPLALFVIDRSTKALRPVAIQCQQTPAADNPIFTPQDGYNWLIAKTIVETADGNIHEASTHLGRTHLAMEPFVVSSYRQLAAHHPLSILLWPHFEGTLAINKAAWQHLIADKGAVDKLFGCSVKAARSVAALGVQSVRIMNDLLPQTFAQRGVDDRTAFPEYPYRDDSLLYWDAIHEWVSAYLRLYYQTDADIQQDNELQAWSRELVSQNGGRLKGMPNDGALRRIEELIEVVTFVIYTCSVQHAAVNFPQYDHMSYTPNMPLATYRPAPTSKSGATEADFVAMLPTLDMAELQMELGYLLGTCHYTELGQYDEDNFRDLRVAAPLQRFQTRLADIERTIAERNQTRRPYETLAPKGIPQSINI